MPLYFTHEHFLRGVPYLSKTLELLGGGGGGKRNRLPPITIPQLPSESSKSRSGEALLPIRAVAPNEIGPTFRPSAVMGVLVRLMNTMVVMLSDKGVHASERALTGYCLVHRMLIGAWVYAWFLRAWCACSLFIFNDTDIKYN